MKTLNVTVKNKIARYVRRDGDLVCGNSDYQVVFAFDGEWKNYTTKTARFIWNGESTDVEFTGTTCPVPIVINTTLLAVGVYAGSLRTTTPAYIPCRKSILCSNPPKQKTEQEKTVNITQNGTVEISPDYGRTLAKVTAIVNVAGTGDRPTLHAPTIAISSGILTITNPASNGDFATSYALYDGTEIVSTTTNETLDLSNIITAAGAHQVSVKATGENFNDSPASNQVTYTVRTLDTPQNVTLNGAEATFDKVSDATKYEFLLNGITIGEVEK